MKNPDSITNRIPFQFWAILILLNLVLILSVLNTQILHNSNQQAPLASSTLTVSPSVSSPSDIPVSTSNSIIEPSVEYSPIPTKFVEGQNLFFFSINFDGKFQIYAFSPGLLPFTRLFDNDFEEISPVVNPSNTKLAYSARKNGYWDIYIYDLISGQETRITDTPEYEGSPSWSPDGQYLAFETYKNNNLDIEIQTLDDLAQAPILLTTSQEADFSPAWSPNGREIAFVSTRSGEDEIWVAKLDTVEDRFSNISLQPDRTDQHPSWSPDGNTIIWSSEEEGYPTLQTYNRSEPNQIIQKFSEGDFPIWLDDQVFFLDLNANQSFITSRSIKINTINLPPILLPNPIEGYSVLKINDENKTILQQLAQSESKLKVLQDTNGDGGFVSGQSSNSLQKIDDIIAPYPFLIADAAESFLNLRENTMYLVGWDFLNTLENAFIPITEPNNPGNEKNWLYTGRAIEFNPLTLYADLAIIIREERNGQTYWRVFLKCRYQDGSQGIPLHQMIWQLDSRYSNDAITYETGGGREAIPDGYWIDFTALALTSGWERLPSLPNWRTYFPGARFNQFAFTDELDWYSAMNEIYPVEALRSPTSMPTITITPSLTATTRYFRSPTATMIPTETLVPTRRPTWTPSP